MGGTIGVWSNGPGKGSEFWFTLPVEYQKPTKQGHEGGDSDPSKVLWRKLMLLLLLLLLLLMLLLMLLMLVLLHTANYKCSS